MTISTIIVAWPGMKIKLQSTIYLYALFSMACAILSEYNDYWSITICCCCCCRQMWLFSVRCFRCNDTTHKYRYTWFCRLIFSFVLSVLLKLDQSISMVIKHFFKQRTLRLNWWWWHEKLCLKVFVKLYFVALTNVGWKPAKVIEKYGRCW